MPKNPSAATPATTIHKTDKHQKPWRNGLTHNAFAGSAFKSGDKSGA